MKELIKMTSINTGEDWYFPDIDVMLLSVKVSHKDRPISLKQLIVYDGAIAVYMIRPVYLMEKPNHL